MKQRIINDTFWTDPYVEDLDPSEKLIFLYLLTNPLCNIAGIYEVKPRRMAFETGFDKDMVEKILERFVSDNKILRVDNWVLLKNFAKNQSTNPNVLKGMQRIIDGLPEKVKACKGFDSLSHFTLLNLTLPNLTILNSTGLDEKLKDFSDSDSSEPETPNPIILNSKENLKNLAIKFLTQDFLGVMLGKYNISSEGLTEQLTLFADYWNEKSDGGKKEKRQMEKTFDIRKRVNKWLNNNNKWTSKNNFDFTKSSGIVLVPDNF